MTSYIFLAMQPDLRMSVPAVVGATAFVTIILAVVFFAGEKGLTNWSPAVILAVAAVLRILFLFRPPELSDDIYRYLWDGLRTLSGHNPYSAAPSTVQAHNEVFIQLLKHVNHPGLITIYPPASEIIFAIGAFFGHTVAGIKALLLVTDLATCYILLRLLSLLNLPPWRSILYAWHPLPVIEIAASGHIDGSGIFFFLIALLLLLKTAGKKSSEPATERSLIFQGKTIPVFLAGLFFSFAALVKFFPLVYFPGLLMAVKKRGRTMFVVGVISGAAVLILPFLPEIRNSLITLNTYLGNWEFSGFVFRTLRNLTSSGSIARLLLAFTFLMTAIFSYLKLLSGKTSPVGNAFFRLPAVRFPDPIDPDTFLNLLKTFYFITMSFLLLTTTLYPWYALFLACLLPFAAGPAGIVLSWTVFLAYKVLIPYSLLGLWIEDGRTPATIWAAPVLAFLLTALTKKTSKYNESSIAFQ
jgi:hypothetical protein